MGDTKREEIDHFILEANRHHPTIKYTAEISEEKTNFLDTAIFKGKRFYKDSIFDIRTHFKPTKTFQYTHFSSCHTPGVKKEKPLLTSLYFLVVIYIYIYIFSFRDIVLAGQNMAFVQYLSPLNLTDSGYD